MKIFLSTLFIFFSMESLAVCTFKNGLKKVVSLSGPMTVLLNELELIDDPAFLGVSVFNPIPKNKFKKKIYPGGIFLANSTIRDFSNALVFYDESRHVNEVLKLGDGINAEEIKTRNLLPLEVTGLLIKKLKNYVNDCDKGFLSYQIKSELIQEKLLNKIPAGLEIIFYLGEFKNNRPPELVMVHDGVVKLLIKEKKIKTYPSELSYVSWSARIMSSFSSQTKHVAIKDSGMTDTRQIFKSSNKVTLVYPGSLVPGLSQLEAFLYLVNNF